MEIIGLGKIAEDWLKRLEVDKRAVIDKEYRRESFPWTLANIVLWQSPTYVDEAGNLKRFLEEVNNLSRLFKEIGQLAPNRQEKVEGLISGLWYPRDDEFYKTCVSLWSAYVERQADWEMSNGQTAPRSLVFSLVLGKKIGFEQYWKTVSKIVLTPLLRQKPDRHFLLAYQLLIADKPGDLLLELIEVMFNQIIEDSATGGYDRDRREQLRRVFRLMIKICEIDGLGPSEIPPRWRDLFFNFHQTFVGMSVDPRPTKGESSTALRAEDEGLIDRVYQMITHTFF